MLNKMLLRRIKKALDREGVGDLPEAIEKMLTHAEKIPAILAYMLLSQVGIFDTMGLMWFCKRILKKFVKAYSRGGSKNGGQSKGSQSSVPGVQDGCKVKDRPGNGGPGRPMR
jgi:hypothetical protein